MLPVGWPIRKSTTIHPWRVDFSGRWQATVYDCSGTRLLRCSLGALFLSRILPLDPATFHPYSLNYPCTQSSWYPTSGVGPQDDDTPTFLNATGLWASQDLEDRCHHRYEWDESITYPDDIFVGQDVIGQDPTRVVRKHPFKKAHWGSDHKYCDNEFPDASSDEHKASFSMLNDYCEVTFCGHDQHITWCKEGKHYLPEFWWTAEHPRSLGTPSAPLPKEIEDRIPSELLKGVHVWMTFDLEGNIQCPIREEPEKDKVLI